jgi:hypothetical protein
MDTEDKETSRHSGHNDSAQTDALRSEIADLEAQTKALKDSVKAVSDQLNSILLKQIEILTIFVAVLALVITNVIGIDAFGNIGIQGLVRIDLIFVVSVFILIFGVKLFILGFRKR